MTEPEPPTCNALLRFMLPAALVLAVVTAVWWVTRRGPLLIQGEVLAPSVDVSARTLGRIGDVRADQGDTVDAGVLLVTPPNPQLVTAHAAAASGLEVARASEAAAGSTRTDPATRGRRDLGTCGPEAGTRTDLVWHGTVAIGPTASGPARPVHPQRRRRHLRDAKTGQQGRNCRLYRAACEEPYSGAVSCCVLIVAVVPVHPGPVAGCQPTVLQDKKMHPTMVEQRPQPVMVGQHVDNRLTRGFD